jgi:lipid II:glycine glycyltransferase (peptidoglycan interpeptide bridge formation enzyme)
MWNAIKWYSQNGYQMFDMGRTELTNEGLNQFKNGWGTQQRHIDYFRYDFRRREFVEDAFEVNALLNKVFSYLPISLLKIIGAFVYRHVG